MAPEGPALHEAIRGAYPPIDFIAADVLDHTRTTRGHHRRGPIVVKRAEYWHDRAATLSGNNGYLHPEQDVISDVYLHTLTHVNLNDVFRDKKGNGISGQVKRDLREQIIIARDDHRQAILRYLEVFDGQPDELMYEGLDTLVYDARCLLLNHRDLRSGELENNNPLLNGLLAEIKVHRALLDLGIENRFSTRMEEINSIDNWVVVNDAPMGIQVKSNSSPDHVFGVSVERKYRKNYVLVRVPTAAGYPRFNLSKNHMKKLSGRLERYSRTAFPSNGAMRLAIAGAAR